MSKGIINLYHQLINQSLIMTARYVLLSSGSYLISSTAKPISNHTYTNVSATSVSSSNSCQRSIIQYGPSFDFIRPFNTQRQQPSFQSLSTLSRIELHSSTTVHSSWINTYEEFIIQCFPESRAAHGRIRFRRIRLVNRITRDNSDGIHVI